MTKSPILSLRNVESRVHGAVKLSGVSVDVYPGELVSILGANGAGKTSLLGVVAGLYRPTSGEILLDGQPITGMAPHRIARMGIGIAPQNHPIFGSLTVAETLDLRPPNYRVDILSLFPNLAAKRSYRAASLSGGERQMLSMALALQADPKICILDEPSSGLAPKIGDKDRAAYLTWLVYADSVFDPAVALHTLKLEYQSSGVSFGTFDDMVANLDRRLSQSEFIAGERFTAADVQVAGSMAYVMQQKWLPERPAFTAYLARTTQRPAALRAQAKDMEMARSIPALAVMFKGQ